MASVRVLKRSSTYLSSITANFRCISTTPNLADKEDGWLSKLLVRRIEPTKESHSQLLSDKEMVYEVQTHNVNPASVDAYMKNAQNIVDLVKSKPELNIELVAAWSVLVGDQDQTINLIRHIGGYAGLDKTRKFTQTDPDYVKLVKERGSLIRSRHSQYMLSFSFWPAITPRKGENIYELRSYILKPGTMIEWGNNWARAINYRQDHQEPFSGLFSQVGRLYNVHHIWTYKDLQQRKEARENAWRKPGWDECVAYTVPLIREMETRLLTPLSFSPTQ